MEIRRRYKGSTLFLVGLVQRCERRHGRYEVAWHRKAVCGRRGPGVQELFKNWWGC